MISDELRQHRLKVIKDHLDTEVTKEFDPTLTTRTAFPDQRHDNVRYHVADDAVIVEFDLLGTNLGEFYGLPPTGRAFRVPIAGVFFFDGGDGGRIVNERIYFDSASLVTQIGRGALLAAI